MRLIDADALIKKWENVHSKDMSFEMAIIGAINDVKNAPTVDAVPVRHGKWKLIRMEDDGNGFYMCSNCERGDTHYPLASVPYCWYCGARMDEERKE